MERIISIISYFLLVIVMKPNSDFERSRMELLFVLRKINRIVLLGYKGHFVVGRNIQ